MGMQGLPAKGLDGLARCRRQQRGLGLEARAVGLIAQQRMADVREMDPNLVGSPGLQPAGKKARDRFAVGAGVFLQELPVSYRLAAALPDGLLVARLGMAVDRGVDRASWAVWHAPDEGEISPFQRA